MRSDRWSDRVESSGPVSPKQSRFPASKANNSSRSIQGSGSRVSRRRLLGLADELSARDRAVLEALHVVRVLSGRQLERLAFAEVTGSARGRIRRRVVGRLVGLGLVVTLQRRVGGVRAGSAGLVYALSGGGQRLIDLESGRGQRRRPPHTPGALFLAHALAVSEVFVALHEASRTVPGLLLVRFAVEHEARWEGYSPGVAQVLRPDALVVLEHGGIQDIWWLEVDRGTESLSRLAGMLRRYLDFAESGEAGPGGVVPRVLVSVPDERRRAAVRALVRKLLPPASMLFALVLADEAADLLVQELLSGEVEKPPP